MAFYLNCLPCEWMVQIPRSTRHDWRRRDQQELFGYEWSRQNHMLLKTLQEVACSRRLLQVNRALLRLVALRRFMATHAGRIKVNAFQINEVLLNTVEKMRKVLGLEVILKGIDLSYSGYIRLRNKVACQYSLLPFCRAKHPGQLLRKEVEVIKKYCSDNRFSHWPLSSVFHQMIRDKAAHFSLHTFYKYASLLHVQRATTDSRRKNHTVGIRAEQPLQILHADSTILRTADGKKNYIHLVQDNCSRAILGHVVSKNCTASDMFNNLSNVIDRYLAPAGVRKCQLITDDGSENTAGVALWANEPFRLSVGHLIAQRDISFSNSMIEAANKQLKYRFLYHRYIPDHNALLKYIAEAIEDYNNRPHDVLHGLTPLEVLAGKRYDQSTYLCYIAVSKVARMAENKKTRCCRSGL